MALSLQDSSTVSDTLAPTIQGFALGSSSLDPSQPGGAYLSAAIRFSDDLSGLSGSDSGSVRFRSTSSNQTWSLSFSSYDLQGSTLAGTVYASQKLDPITAAGSWSLDSIQLSDKAGNSFYKSSSSSDWTSFLSSSGITQTSFQIAYGPNPAPGTGPDSLAPSIEGFSLDSTSLDPSQPGGAYLSAALRVSDNLSGFNSGYIYFRSPSSGQFHSISLSLDNLQGSTLAGTLYASRKLYPAMTAGSWELYSILLGDKAGNSLYKTSLYSSDWNSFLSSSGITQTSFQVVYGSNPAPGTGPDSLAPSIQGFSLVSTSLDPSQPGGALLSGRLSFKDNVSGFDRGYVTFSSDSGEYINLFFGYPAGGGHIISGTELSGVAFASAQLKATAAAGIWRLSSVWLSDKAGNSLYKTSRYSSDWNSFLSSSGITQSSFQVTYGPNPAPGTGPDSLAPTIQGFSLDSSSLDPSQPGGAFLSGRLTFKDNVSGFDMGYLRFSSDAGDTTSLYFGYWNNINIISGSDLSGVAFASSQLAATDTAGTWRLSSIYLSDKANNSLSISSYSSDWATFLSSSGITQTSFDVVYGGAPTPPVISLAVSPASVTEDGTANLIYTFSRTGTTTSSLTVNYTVTGTSTNGTDYTGIAIAPATKTLSFAAGAATASLTVDPTADIRIEPDETIAPSLAAGNGYSIGTTAAVVGTIINDDTAIENQGNTALLRGGNGQTYVSVGNTTTPITYLGTPTSPGTASSTWQMLAAETIGGSNKILWRYNPTGQIHVWALNSNWGWTSSDTGLVDTNSSAGWGLESSFQLDLNSDSIIGAPLTPIELQGNTSLGRHISTAQAYVSVGNTATPITYLGSPSSPGNASSTWQMLAAETIGGSNKLLWRNNPTGQLHVWALNSNWGWTGSDTGLVDANSSTGWGLESSFQLDLNGDSIIGAPYTTIESQGNTSLVRNTSAQAYVNVGDTSSPITYLGTPTSPGNSSSTWQMLAAETIGGSNKLLWRYNPTTQVHVWTLNSSWGWTGSDTGLVNANSSAGLNLLAQFGLASI